MTPDERYDLIDLLPDDMVIWDDDEELSAFPWDLRKWLDVLGHKKAHPGCCKACGCATTCMASAFHEALITSVVRELDKLGVLHAPSAGLVVVSADLLRDIQEAFTNLGICTDRDCEHPACGWISPMLVRRLRAALPEGAPRG